MGNDLTTHYANNRNEHEIKSFYDFNKAIKCEKSLINGINFTSQSNSYIFNIDYISIRINIETREICAYRSKYSTNKIHSSNVIGNICNYYIGEKAKICIRDYLNRYLMNDIRINAMKKILKAWRNYRAKIIMNNSILNLDIALKIVSYM